MTKRKKCQKCKQFFEKPYVESVIAWMERKYCSKYCADKARIGRVAWNKGLKGQVPWNKGKKGLQEAWNKGNGEYAKKLGFGKWMSEKKGEEANAWKGDEVGYTALHDWVRSRLGRPNKCENCGLVSNKRNQLHWANVSHEYKRDLQDWIRLCAKCHKKHDKGFKQKIFNIKYGNRSGRDNLGKNQCTDRLERYF